MTYRDYIKKRIKTLVRMGYLPQDAMRIAAREWKSGFRTANPKKVYRTVTTFRSKSDPSKTYTVKADEQGNLLCSCPAWIFKKGGVRTCPHIETVKARMNPSKIKYRAYHYYPDEPFLEYKYDHLDFEDKNAAITHCRKSRTCEQVRVIIGNKVNGWINLRTGAIENPIIFDTLFGKPKGLYESFHGNPPQVRKVRVRVPNKGEQLVSIGRLTAIEYQPYGSSRRKRTTFIHKLGDTGSRMLPEKPILATGKNGKGLFVIEDKSSPKFTERGIEG